MRSPVAEALGRLDVPELGTATTQLTLAGGRLNAGNARGVDDALRHVRAAASALRRVERVLLRELAHYSEEASHP